MSIVVPSTALEHVRVEVEDVPGPREPLQRAAHERARPAQEDKVLRRRAVRGHHGLVQAGESETGPGDVGGELVRGLLAPDARVGKDVERHDEGGRERGKRGVERALLPQTVVGEELVDRGRVDEGPAGGRGPGPGGDAVDGARRRPGTLPAGGDLEEVLVHGEGETEEVPEDEAVDPLPLRRKVRHEGLVGVDEGHHVERHAVQRGLGDVVLEGHEDELFGLLGRLVVEQLLVGVEAPQLEVVQDGVEGVVVQVGRAHEPVEAVLVVDGRHGDREAHVLEQLVPGLGRAGLEEPVVAGQEDLDVGHADGRRALEKGAVGRVDPHEADGDALEGLDPAPGRPPLLERVEAVVHVRVGPLAVLGEHAVHLRQAHEADVEQLAGREVVPVVDQGGQLEEEEGGGEDGHGVLGRARELPLELADDPVPDTVEVALDKEAALGRLVQPEPDAAHDEEQERVAGRDGEDWHVQEGGLPEEGLKVLVEGLVERGAGREAGKGLLPESLVGGRHRRRVVGIVDDRVDGIDHAHPTGLAHLGASAGVGQGTDRAGAVEEVALHAVEDVVPPLLRPAPASLGGEPAVPRLFDLGVPAEGRVAKGRQVPDGLERLGGHQLEGTLGHVSGPLEPEDAVDRVALLRDGEPALEPFRRCPARAVGVLLLVVVVVDVELGGAVGEPAAVVGLEAVVVLRLSPGPVEGDVHVATADVRLGRVLVPGALPGGGDLVVARGGREVAHVALRGRVLDHGGREGSVGQPAGGRPVAGVPVLSVLLFRRSLRRRERR